MDMIVVLGLCGLDDVFPPDDLGSGPRTPVIIYTSDAPCWNTGVTKFKNK